MNRRFGSSVEETTDPAAGVATEAADPFTRLIAGVGLGNPVREGLRVAGLQQHTSGSVEVEDPALTGFQ
jgi:hypothetical protein